MIDTDKIDNMKQWTDGYKVRMFWDLVAEIKRLREVIKKIKECATINAQHDDILEKQEWEYILELIE